MQWNSIFLLYQGMLIVYVSCKRIWRYALIIRIKLRSGCDDEIMMNLKLNLISLIPE